MKSVLAVVGILAACASQPDRPGHLLATPLPPLRSAEECRGVVAPRGGAGPGYQAPDALQMVAPPKPPERYRGREIHLLLRINALGKVDSAVIGAIPDSAYVRSVRKTLERWSFTPATFEQCAVVGWTLLSFTFSKSS